MPPGIFGHRGGEDGINPWMYQWKDGAPRRTGIAEADQRMYTAKAGMKKRSTDE